jgi:spermidine synthase
VSARLVHTEKTPDGALAIREEDDRRSLWFDDVVLQTEINLDDPAVLPNPVNRAMLAHLMFGAEPQRVLLAGCGGGAIARWFHARSPHTRGDAVELSAQIARIARRWFDFPDGNSGWRIRIDDVRHFLAAPQTSYDFILVDLEEDQWTPDWVTGTAFLNACHAALGGGGVLTVNTINRDRTAFTRALAETRAVFERRTLVLPVPGYDNVLVLAFRDAPQQPPDPAAAARRWGLPFGDYLALVKRHNPAGNGLL